MQKGSHDFGSRRTTRVEKLLPVRVRILHPFGGVEWLSAWTVVVNRHGAKFECNRPLEWTGKVAITILSTGTSTKGELIWSKPRPNHLGNFEFAVELDEPGNVWGVNLPPLDWGLRETAEPAEACTEEACIKQGGQEPNLDAQAFMRELEATAASLRTSEQPKLPSKFPQSTLKVPASRVDSSAADAFSGITESEGYSRRRQELQEEYDHLTDRLGEVVQALIRSAVDIQQRAASDRLIERAEKRLSQAQEQHVADLREGARNLTLSQNTLMESHTFHLQQGIAHTIDEGIRQLAEIAEQGSRQVQQESAKAIPEALESLWQQIAQYSPALQDQLLEQFRLRVEQLLSESMDASTRNLSAQTDAVAKKMGERAECIAGRSLAGLEERFTQLFSEMTSRIEAQMEEAARNIRDSFHSPLLEEMSEKQEVLLEEAREQIRIAAGQKILELRVEVGRIFWQLGATVEEES